MRHVRHEDALRPTLFFQAEPLMKNGASLLMSLTGFAVGFLDHA